MFHPSPGAVVSDRYELQAPIGQGGMGGVWRAIDRVLQAPVALKVMLPTSDEPEAEVTRFLREARLSASVQHPNVVRVTDFGTHEGAPFITMELLEGLSLAERLDQLPRLSIGESIQIVAAVLRGLAAAHDAGVVHRDVKPENVFLVEGADGVYPKLLDFGISLGTWGEERVSAVTTGGRVMGTPAYMAPEQARGLPDIDHRVDVYGVGAMLFEMICHRTPFVTELPGDLLVAIVRDAPPSPLELRPAVGEQLSGVVLKALEKDPEDRYVSARALRAALLAAAPPEVALGADITGPISLKERPRRQRGSEVPTLGDDDDVTLGDDPAIADTEMAIQLPGNSTRRARTLAWAVLAMLALGSVGLWMSSRGTETATAEDREPSIEPVPAPEVAPPDPTPEVAEAPSEVPEPQEEPDPVTSGMAQRPTAMSTRMSPRAFRELDY